MLGIEDVFDKTCVSIVSTNMFFLFLWNKASRSIITMIIVKVPVVIAAICISGRESISGQVTS